METATVTDVRGAIERAEQITAERKAAAVSAFWQTNDKGMPLIPQDVVDELLSTGETVTIHAVRDGSSKFGATWFTDITRDNGERWTCPQAHNNVRDRLMLAIRSFLADYGAMPAGLHGFDTAQGSGWDFGPPFELQVRANGETTPAIDDVPF